MIVCQSFQSREQVVRGPHRTVTEASASTGDVSGAHGDHNDFKAENVSENRMTCLMICAMLQISPPPRLPSLEPASHASAPYLPDAVLTQRWCLLMAPRCRSD